MSSWAAPEGASGYWFGAFILLGMICGTPFIVYNRAKKRW